MFTNRFILLPILLLLVHFGWTQSAPIHFTALSTRDGLLSNSVNAIIKDRFGMMWIATDDGLNKFDGTNFTVYRHQPGDATSLRANEILTLHEDAAGNLWIGTSGGGLSRYDRKKNFFIHYPVAGQSGQLPTNAVVRGISSDQAGNVWVAQYENLFLLNPATNALSRVDLSQADNSPANARILTCVLADSRNRIWVGTLQGIYLYESTSGRVRRFQSNPGQPGSLLNNEIRAIAEDKDGLIWIGTPAGLCSFRTNGAGFDTYNYLSGPASGLSSHEINCIAPDEAGHLWIGTTEGLNIADTRSHRVTTYFPQESNTYSLTSKWIRCVYIDRQGIYWLGTFRGGINKYDQHLNLFDLKLSKTFFPQTRSATIVSAFAEGRNGEVYIGSDGGGLYRYNRKTGQVSEVDLGLPVHDRHPLTVLALQVSTDNKLYVGTYAWGLIVMDLATGKSQYLHQGPGPNELNSNNIFAIKEDSRQQIWVGTNGEGVNVLRNGQVTMKFTPHPRPGLINESLLPMNGFVRAIEEDTAGNMWIGSHGGGINVYHPGNGKWTTYTQSNSQLPSDKVQAILCDSRGRIWAGTFGEGLSLYDPVHKSFQTYSEKDGLQNTTMYQILEDFNGLLWLSTNSGISSFDVEKKAFRNYTYRNGVQNNNFVRASGLRLSDGDLVFGGLEGFNYFNPAGLTTNHNVPRVMLTNLRISNKSVVPGEEAPIKSHISVADEVHLAYKQNFALDFVALNYTLPSQNLYAYKLEGFDKDWNYSGTTNTASYTNLDPGEYTFHLKAANNDGIWSNGQLMIRINVHPPFWRTTWAYILYALAVCGVLLYSRHVGILRIRKKFQLEQERQEARRIQELDRLKIKFLTNLSHDFRTPISLIMGPIDQLIVQEKTEYRLDKLNMIKRNARRLLNLVNQLLDFRKMEEHELQLQLSQGDLINFVKEVTDAFMDFAERKHIHFLFQTDIHTLQAFFDHDKLERILFNLLSNAFKFTLEGGNVRVELTTINRPADPQHQWVSIKVKDSGIGIAKAKQEHIFDRFFQSNNSTSILNQGTGIGLSITREFVRLHGGTIRVDSEPAQGATFTIELPLQMVVPLPASEPPAQSGSAIALDTSATIIREEEAESAVFAETAVNNAWSANPADLPLILLVEDNEDYRLYLKDSLRNSYKVLEAANGKEGWQKALAHHPQMIVSDISMPEMDGICLVQKLKADKRTNHIPVILLTALTAEEQEIAGLETGANDYITKPFNADVLHAKIRNLLHLNFTLKSTYSKQLRVLTPEVATQSADEQLLHKIVHYLEENLTNSQLSVENLSKEVGMSRSSLYNKLLELTGQTPVEYIRSYRLDKAAALLEKSDMTIAEIAYQVGFSTPNYFAKSFKTKFNILPSEFVARMRKGSGDSE